MGGEDVTNTENGDEEETDNNGTAEETSEGEDKDKPAGEAAE